MSAGKGAGIGAGKKGFVAMAARWLACASLMLSVRADARTPATAKESAPRTPARSHEAATPRTAPRAATPLPMLPSVSRVRVEIAHNRIVAIEEVSLPRGDWRSGGLDLYVAFGAPGVPVAIDAHLFPVDPQAPESRPEDSGSAMTIEPAVRRSTGAQLLLGPANMAGVVVRVKESDLRRAYAASDVASLRIRSLLDPPVADPHGARDIVVRLGISGDVPLTLGHVQLVSLDADRPIAGAEATLCGPEADPVPLAVKVVPSRAELAPPAAAAGLPPARGRIAPAMAVRHASDDLCIRWW
jgi:hypothetical protein